MTHLPQAATIVRDRSPGALQSDAAFAGARFKPVALPALTATFEVSRTKPEQKPCRQDRPAILCQDPFLD